MSLIVEAVQKLHSLIEGSGCEEGIVSLTRDPNAPKCQYENGVCIRAHFGGGHGQVMTGSPLQATVRISFMYGSSLQSPKERTAALAILNAASGFLCLTRKLHACREQDLLPCVSELHKILSGKKVACIGYSAVLSDEFSKQMVIEPEEAEVLLVVADGAISESTALLIDQFRGKKPMIFLGPSFPGLSVLLDLEHWCPYGR